jgi:hypothetical protein
MRCRHSFCSLVEAVFTKSDLLILRSLPEVFKAHPASSIQTMTKGSIHNNICDCAKPSNRHAESPSLNPAQERDDTTSGTLLPLTASKADYEALSYFWGTNVKNASILVDGKHLDITQNRHDALGRLRLGEHRQLWMDAICIKQEDIPERNIQVAYLRTNAGRRRNRGKRCDGCWN